MRAGFARRTGAPVVAAALLFGLLAVPGRPSGFAASLAQAPLEWLVLVGGLVLLPRNWRGQKALAGVLSFALMAVLILKVADFAMLSALNRPFNPVVDLYLIRAGLNVLSGSIGTFVTGLIVVAGLMAFCGTAVGVFRAVLCLARLDPLPGSRPWAGAAVLGCGALVMADLGQARGVWRTPLSPPGTALNARIASDHVARSLSAVADLRAFRLAAAEDPYADRTGLFDATDGRDILILFVESYGRASFDNPLYSETHVPTLRAAQTRLEQTGYVMQSGWLTSPTAGGQSWLAHGTLASGLRTSDQGRYGAMLASGRQNLFHLAQGSGFRTAAVMPAITMAWPEGLTMGFDTILAARDLNYAGQPFNWITMPDQYTLSAFEELLPPDPRADFLQIALISSHAPWVPVPQMIDWADVGDGTVFDQWATAGDPPSVVWRDRDRVREQYRKAIDYALQAATDYAARRADLPLILILGDHQPASFVAGIDSRDVAAHLIGPPDLVARVASWGWRDGLVPDADTPVWPMEAFRDRFIRAFTVTDADGETM